MLVASRLPVPFAMLPWRTVPGRATLVAKVAFDVRAGGVATISQRHDPLSDEARGPDGIVIFPSDFVRSKDSCDVIVVGRALVQSRDPCTLVAPGVRKQVEREVNLGALPTLGSDEQGIQQAPADQRTRLALPAKIRLQRRERSLEAMLPGPIPQIGVLRGQELELLNVTIDTVALDPERARIVIAARAIIDGLDTWASSGATTMFVTDVLGMLTADDADEPWAWDRANVEVRQPAPSFPEPDNEDSMSVTVSLGQPSPSAQPTVQQPPPPSTAQPPQRAFARTVPMQTAARVAPNRPQAPAGLANMDLRNQKSTIAMQSVPTAAFGPAGPSRPSSGPSFGPNRPDLDDDESTIEPAGAMLRGPSMTRKVPTGELAPPPMAMATGTTRRIELPQEVEGFTLAQLTALEREVAESREGRAVVLRRRNLGELRFRLIERKWLERLVAAGLADPRTPESGLYEVLVRLTGG